MGRRLPWRHFRVALYDDERYLGLPLPAGLLFHRLHLICDRHGRGSIPPAAGWMAARFPDRETFEEALIDLSASGLVLVFVCVKHGVRCFEIVDYQVDAPAQLLRRSKTPSDWQRPTTADNAPQRRTTPDNDGQRRTVTGDGGRSAANGPQPTENTAATPARARGDVETRRSEKGEGREETRDLPIAGTRTRSAANVSQPPDLTSRDGADAFAERWDDTPVSFPPGLSQATIEWLAAVGDARQAVGLPWTGKGSDHLREALGELVEAFDAELVDRAMAEHVRVGKALGQRGQTPLRFLKALCEQEAEARHAQQEARRTFAPTPAPQLPPKKEPSWNPPPGETREEYVARMRRECREASEAAQRNGDF